MVLALADTQILTGLGILVSGFISLPCGLSVYHWQMVTYLAWFAAVTHLSALTFLRNYFYNHRTKLAWRVVLMFVLQGLLMGAAFPTGHFDFTRTDYEALVEPKSHAICYYRATMDTDTIAFQSMLLFDLLLIYGFGIRVFKLSRRAT